MKLPEDMAILLVEDDRAHARLIEFVLRRTGVENPLVWIQSGTEALDYLFNQGRYLDNRRPLQLLVLLDLNLPGTDGHEILQRMRDVDETRDVPVIVVTSSADPDERARCQALGCSEFLEKPPAPHAFAEALERMGFG